MVQVASHNLTESLEDLYSILSDAESCMTEYPVPAFQASHQAHSRPAVTLKV